MMNVKYVEPWNLGHPMECFIAWAYAISPTVASTVLLIMMLILRPEVKLKRIEVAKSHDKRIALLESKIEKIERNATGKQQIYIIADSSGHIKIGVALEPFNRLCELQTANSNELKLIKVFSVTDPTKIENKLHGKYNRYRVRGEWFDMPPTKLMELFRDARNEKMA
jgi:hypothetical protein